MGTEQRGTGPTVRLGGFIRAHREELIREWRRRIPTVPKGDASYPRRLDHIPEILDRIASAADEEHPDLDEHLAHAPEEHAVDRLDEGIELSVLIGEYTLLRAIVLERWQREIVGGMEPAEVMALDRAFDEAITGSVGRYTFARERTLVALDRILDAATNPAVPGEDDHFLDRLLQVLLETTEAVDSVTILLREGDRLCVRAAIGVEAELRERFSVAIGEGFAGAIAAERKPRELRYAATDPLVLSPAMRDHGVRALYGVPMLRGDELIGVAHMGSRTAWMFSNEAKVLFRTMVSRATSLLMQRETFAALERANDELRRERDERDAILQAISDLGEGFLVLSDDRVLAINDAVVHLTGYRADELGDVPRMIDLVIPEERERVLERSARRLRGDDPPSHYETSFRHKDGHRVDVEVSAKRGASGLVAVLVRDVSDRKRAETERAELHAAIERERALLESVMREVPVGILIAEAKSERVLLANETCAKIWRSPSALDALTYREGRVFTPDGRTMRVDDMPLSRALRGERVVDEPCIIERGDDTTGHVLASAAPIRDGAGEVVAAVVAFMDISELRGAQQRLGEALLDRERMMAILGHDLRNPLSAIVVTAARLLQQRELLEGNRRAVARIAAAADRMNRMIRDLLDYSGARSDGLPIAREPGDLADSVRAAIEELEVAHPDRRIEVQIGGPLHGAWDRQRMAQVVSNLVGNALVHGHAGEPVSVTLDDAGDQALLSVANRGAPIPRSLLPSLFEPFRRGADAGRQGLGLGLFIVREIVKAHRGTIDVTSDVDTGTTFTVRLPKT